MTKEDKELLIEYICGRLFNLPRIVTNDGDEGYITGVDDLDEGLFYVHILEDGESYDASLKIDKFKLCLRPLSSMTNEERLHLEVTWNFYYRDGVLNNVDIFTAGGTWDRDGNYDEPREYRSVTTIQMKDILEIIHWLNVNHFDYQIVPSTGKTLIESGLAVEMTETHN